MIISISEREHLALKERIAELERRAVNAEQEAEKWQVEALRYAEERLQAARRARTEVLKRCDNAAPNMMTGGHDDQFIQGWNDAIMTYRNTIRALGDE